MLEAYAAQEAERLLQQQVTIQQAMTERLEQQRLVGEIAWPDVVPSHLAMVLKRGRQKGSGVVY